MLGIWAPRLFLKTLLTRTHLQDHPEQQGPLSWVALSLGTWHVALSKHNPLPEMSTMVSNTSYHPGPRETRPPGSWPLSSKQKAAETISPRGWPPLTGFSSMLQCVTLDLCRNRYGICNGCVSWLREMLECYTIHTIFNFVYAEVWA